MRTSFCLLVGFKEEGGEGGGGTDGEFGVARGEAGGGAVAADCIRQARFCMAWRLQTAATFQDPPGKLVGCSPNTPGRRWTA